MLLIKCPWCGERIETEFVCGGESHVMRPSGESASDPQWTGYLYLRENALGFYTERWWHVHGCRRWFNVRRHTVTHQIDAVYRMDEAPPPLSSP